MLISRHRAEISAACLSAVLFLLQRYQSNFLILFEFQRHRWLSCAEALLEYDLLQGTIMD
jgi:hypothetical protein